MRNYRNRFSRNKFSRTDNNTITGMGSYGPEPIKMGPPTPETVSTWTTRQYGNKLSLAPVSLLLNPGEEALKVAQPYPIINSNNTTIERNYAGKSNQNGLIVSDITNNPRSKMTNEFDSGKLTLRLAYKFLKMKEVDTSVQPYNAVNFQYNQAFVEGRSRVQSELWTQSDFNQSTFTSSIPHMENNMLGALLHYQTTIQNLILVMSKFNQLQLLQQDMVNMGFDNESHILVELFSQFKKTAFLSKWFVLANFIQKEYVDQEWIKQINNIVNVPSRKSNSVRDPLFSIVGIHEMPDVTIRKQGSSVDYWNSNDFTGQTYTYKANPTPGALPTLEHTEVSYFTMVYNLLDMLDAHTITTWARQLIHGNNNGDGVSVSLAANATQYFNMVTANLDALIRVWSKFTNAYADMRVFLDVAKRTGLIKWMPGLKYGVFKPKSETSVSNNINIRDIIVASCATPNRIRFNFEINKWVFYSLWDEYEGIPKFDTNNGGMDITFSVKRNLLGAEHLHTDSLELCLPFTFRHATDKSVIRMVDRTGNLINIESQSLTGNDVSNNIALNRLIPKKELMGDMTEPMMNIPQVTIPENFKADPFFISKVIRMLTHQFKYGNIVLDKGDTRTYVNPSLICVVDGQMENASTEIVSYIRSSAPLTGVTSR